MENSQQAITVIFTILLFKSLGFTSSYNDGTLAYALTAQRIAMSGLGPGQPAEADLAAELIDYEELRLVDHILRNVVILEFRDVLR